MVKTEFMKLYEELTDINEAITDIDLDSIDTTASEAERLRREVNELEDKFNKQVVSAYAANEEYKKLKDEYFDLLDKLSALKQTYERREWHQFGEDDWRHDDWIDESEYEKVKDQVDELNKLLAEVSAKLEAVKAEAAKQFSSDAEVIKGKRAEMETHQATNKDLKTKLTQAYSEVEDEINEALKVLNNNSDFEYDHDGWKATRNLFYADGRIQTTLYTNVVDDHISYLDPDNFDDDGELRDRDADWRAKDIASDAGATASSIIQDYELEASEDGWFKIPGSDWELYKDSDFETEETPGISYDRYDDYEIVGEFKIGAYIYLGKKVKK
jgi:uncharacterized protein YukE